MVTNNSKVRSTEINVKLLTLYLLFPIFLTLGYISTYLPVVGGLASFPLKSVQCGHEPFITKTFAGSRSYTIPGDRLYGGPNIFTQSSNYYCDESELVKDGYAAMTWKEQCQSTNRNQPVECNSNSDSFSAVLPFFLGLIFLSTLVAYFISVLLIEKRWSNKTSKK